MRTTLKVLSKSSNRSFVIAETYGISTFLSFESKTVFCTLYLARLHNLLNKIKLIAKNLPPKNVEIHNGLAYRAENQRTLLVQELDAKSLS